ncbi:MAG: FAD:protein FMN transferase [Prevotella sp.]|nr:FAD:protein FMN transferase [Prevotella sp.]
MTTDEKRKKKLLWQLPLLTLLIVGTVIIVRQQQSMPYREAKGFIFGTTYSISYQADADYSQEIVNSLERVDNSLSMFNDKSVVTAINNNENMKPDELFSEVFRLAMIVSNETDGAFDITVAPLVNAWGFGYKTGIMPDKHAVDSLLQLVGYTKVTVGADGLVSKSDPRITLDFSAIAKGYGTDVVARTLDSLGVSNYMVEIGGEVVTRGISSKRLPWKIGVTKPTDDTLALQTDLQTVLNVTDRAMATSGNYRNYYYRNGLKYAHTIDPKTGMPVQHTLLSATVLAPSCATADAYATAFMVMGVDKAKAVLDRHPEMMAYFIYSTPDGENAVWFSPSLKEKLSE